MELAGASERRSGCRARQWQFWPVGRLLLRPFSDTAIIRDWLRIALRIRNFSPGHSRRLPGRATGQLAEKSRPLGSVPAGNRLSRAVTRQLRDQRLNGEHHPDRASMLLGVAYDRPIAGYGAHCVNTLRPSEFSTSPSYRCGLPQSGHLAVDAS